MKKVNPKSETVNPSIMPDICCGKYEEEQPLKSIRDKLNPQLTQIGKEPQYITNARESFKCKKEDVIGFDVIERHNKKCFDDTLENIKKSMKDKDFPDIDFRKDIAEELSKDELIDRLCEMHKEYTKMREEWFNVVTMKEHYTKDTTDTLPYPNPISKHQTDINIGWMRAMKYIKNQPVKYITDEEIEKWAQWTIDKYPGGDPDIKNYIKIAKITGAKWMRSKMKSNGKI